MEWTFDQRGFDEGCLFFLRHPAFCSFSSWKRRLKAEELSDGSIAYKAGHFSKTEHFCEKGNRKMTYGNRTAVRECILHLIVCDGVFCQALLCDGGHHGSVVTQTTSWHSSQWSIWCMSHTFTHRQTDTWKVELQLKTQRLDQNLNKSRCDSPVFQQRKQITDEVRKKCQPNELTTVGLSQKWLLESLVKYVFSSY